MTGNTSRQQAISAIVSTKRNGLSKTKEVPMDELFGSNVFGYAQMKASLPKEVFLSVYRKI
jgi:glutamine synthetase type III